MIRRQAQLEMNMLNESLYFACIYVLTQGVVTNPSYGDTVPDNELRLRSLILNTYDEVYSENLTEKYVSFGLVHNRGIDSTTAQSSVFTTIIDLILFSYITNYHLKKNIFLSPFECLSFHHLTWQYPSIDESYFATLPMTHYDEPYLKPLIKSQLSVQSFDNMYNGIVYDIVSSLSTVKLSKPISKFQITVEASMYYFNHSLIY